MEFEYIIKALLSLGAVILGIVLISIVLKKLQTRLPGKLARGAARDLEVVAHMVLDPNHRLVSVRWKSKEHLLCVGGKEPLLIASEKIAVSNTDN